MADEATVAAVPAAEPAVSDAVASCEVMAPLLTLVQPTTAPDPEPVEAAQTNGEKEEKREDEPIEAEKPAETVQTNGNKQPESDKTAEEPAKSDDVQDVSIVTGDIALDMAYETHMDIDKRGGKNDIR